MVVTPRSILTAGLLCLVCAQSDNCGTSVLPLVSRGQPIRPGQYPWLAALYQQDVIGKWDQVCGGVLLSPRIVLTAAHCLVTPERKVIGAKTIKVGLGKLYRDFYRSEDYSNIVNVTTVLVPDRYLDTASSYALDVGLLRLATVVEISDYILPACIDLDTITPVYPGAYVHVAGWGTTENGTSSEQALAARMTYLDYNSCLLKVHVLYRKYVTHDKICALSMNGSYVDQGDSGGALTFSQKGRHFVVGVVSTKIIGETTFSIFTDITSPEIHAWIREQKTNFDKEFCPSLQSDSLSLSCLYGNTELECSTPLPPLTRVTIDCKSQNTSNDKILLLNTFRKTTLICNNNGAWSGQLPECLSVDIPVLAVEEDLTTERPWKYIVNGTSTITISSGVFQIPEAIRIKIGTGKIKGAFVKSDTITVDGICRNIYVIIRNSVTDLIRADCFDIGNRIIQVNGSVIIGTPQDSITLFSNTASTAVVMSGGKCVKKLYSNITSVPGSPSVSKEECAAVLKEVAALRSGNLSDDIHHISTGKMNVVAEVTRENGKCVRKFHVTGKGINDVFSVECFYSNIFVDDGTVFMAGTPKNPFVLYSKSDYTVIEVKLRRSCTKNTYFNSIKSSSNLSENECKAIIQEIGDRYTSTAGKEPGEINVLMQTKKENGRCLRQFLVSENGINDTLIVDCSAVGGDVYIDNKNIFIAGPALSPLIIFVSNTSTLVTIFKGTCTKTTYFNNTKVNTSTPLDDCNALLNAVKMNPPSIAGEESSNDKAKTLTETSKENGECIRKFTVSGNGINDTLKFSCYDIGMVFRDKYEKIIWAKPSQRNFALFGVSASTLLVIFDRQCVKNTYFNNNKVSTSLTQDECRTILKESFSNEYPGLSWLVEF